MKRIISFIGILTLSLFVLACGKDEEDLKLIQKQTVGNYNISVLSSSDKITNGYHSLYIEIRNTSKNELVDAGNINVSAHMQMTGMPMSAEMSTIKTNTTGRYHIKYNFPMSGTWILDVRLEDGQGANFSISVQ